MKSFLSQLARLFPTMESDRTETTSFEPASGAQPELPPFIPDNELEALLVAAAQDPSVRPDFVRRLLTGNLLAATPEAPERHEQRTIDQGESLLILNVTLQDGSTLPAIFSSEQRVAECFGVGTGFVAMQGSILLGIVQDNGAVLNPASAYGVRWSPDDLAAMLGRPVRRTVERDTQITWGTPAHLPEPLVAALDRALKDDARVREAWLALAYWPESDDWSWYLDVRSDSPPDEISPFLADACRPELREGKPLDIVVSPGVDGTGIGIRLKPATDH